MVVSISTSPFHRSLTTRSSVQPGPMIAGTRPGAGIAQRLLTVAVVVWRRWSAAVPRKRRLTADDHYTQPTWN